MGCKECNDKPKNPNRDRNGNIVGTESEMDQREKDAYDKISQEVDQLKLSDRPNPDATYQEYVAGKEKHSKKIRELGPKAVRALTDDQKRIKVLELLSIYNYDDLGMLSPSQALIALWELMKMPEYKTIINEFEDLEAQVTEKYNALMRNKIKIKWNK